MDNIITRDDLKAANHAEGALNQMSGILYKAESRGFEFSLEECRRVLKRLVRGSLTVDEAILDVAATTGCPVTLPRGY